jgi:hypothetical protein
MHFMRALNLTVAPEQRGLLEEACEDLAALPRSFHLVPLLRETISERLDER